MAKQITVCGKQLNLAYSMLAAVTYEKMTGKSALDLSQFQKQHITPLVELGFAMLIASNPEKDVPTMEDMLRDMDTSEKMTAFVTSVSLELTSYFAPDQSADQAPSEDAAKNE